jgi:next-to-BRCA1 protein 1
VTLDPANTHVYKTLFRAAKAKLKLRLRATVSPDPNGSILPPLNPLGMQKMAFASNFPEFVRFGSETTLTGVSGVNTTPQSQPSLETLAPPTQSSTAPIIPPVVSHDQWASAYNNAAQAPQRSSTRLNRDSFFAELANISRQRELTLRMKEPQPVVQPAAAPAPAPPVCSWSVFCNACDKPMANEHYHCNVCDDGDYDLCETCVAAGIHCPGESHWLIKRFVKNGQVINSTTEKLVPKTKAVPQPSQPEMPGAFMDEKKLDDEAEDEPSRTCNSCVKGKQSNLRCYTRADTSLEFSDNYFVTCLDCEDYDLCIPCHEGNKHGHHPGHAFKPTTEDAEIGTAAKFLCAPGRNVKHAALCDGCDKPIHGVRHKCLNCPDWDYCAECHKNAAFIHPLHRFAPIYDPISMPRQYSARHVGIYCDGPLCQNKHDYIQGVRYKCAICHDTDFCDNCEAYPHNKHNRTHPMIMFKTAVRGVGITTMVEDKHGANLGAMGDRQPSKPAAMNTASQVQTIVDLKPAEPSKPTKEKIEIKDLLTEPIQEKIRVEDLLASPNQEPSHITTKVLTPQVDISQLRAEFVRETVPDCSVMRLEQSFVQVWTLRNPGPIAWPAGCSVRYTGGDNMLNVDKKNPSSTQELAAATETNVIARPVEVGEEIAFRVPLKAPHTLGTKISYWRLKTADGQAFGHRLWCHINVVDQEIEETRSQPQIISPRFAPVSVPTVERSEEVGRPSHQQDFLRTVLQQRVDRRRELEDRAAMLSKALEKAKAVQEAQKKAEEEQKSTRAQMLRNLASEIGAVEMQHKARYAAARAAVDAANVAKEATPASLAELPVSTRAFQDYNMQLRLLEEANRKRQAEASRSVPAVQAPAEVEAPAATVNATAVEEPAMESSRMIFPTLEKESPASSTHSIAPAAPAMVAAQPATVSSSGSEADFFEDAESVDLVDSSSEDGFLTDEEYDILDASDEEFA